MAGSRVHSVDALNFGWQRYFHTNSSLDILRI